MTQQRLIAKILQIRSLSWCWQRHGSSASTRRTPALSRHARHRRSHAPGACVDTPRLPKWPLLRIAHDTPDPRTRHSRNLRWGPWDDVLPNDSESRILLLPRRGALHGIEEPKRFIAIIDLDVGGDLQRVIGAAVVVLVDDSLRSTEVICRCLAELDSAALVVRFPKPDDLDVASTRLHEQCEIERVRLIAARPTGRRARAGLDQMYAFRSLVVRGVTR